MKKRIFYIVTLLLAICAITACDLTPKGDGNTYKISYYVNEVNIEHEPSSYVSGEETILLPLNEEGFLGWYNNEELSGSKIEKIKKSEIGDKVFYAKIDQKLPDNKEYNIIYSLNGGKLPLDAPSSYISGTGLKNLPTPTKNGFEFVGWELNGRIVNAISETAVGNVTLSAVWKEKPITEDLLGEALKNMTNYSLVYSFSEKGSTDRSNTYYDSDGTTLKISYIENTGTYSVYLTTIDNVRCFYIEDYDGSYYIVTEDDETFENYYMAYVTFDLSNIDSTMFTLQGGVYKLKDTTKVHEVASQIFGEYSSNEYQDLSITVSNGYITKIEALSKYTFNGEIYDYVYLEEFSNFGNVTITLPDLNDNPNTITISEVYNKADNDSVTVKGYIAGVVGNNVYIQDATSGVYIYLGSTSALDERATLGKEILVSGTKTTFCGLVEIQDIESLDYTGNEKELSPVVLPNLSDETLGSHISQLVSFTNMKIVSLPSSYSLNNKDHSIKISDGTNETTLFISKHVDSAYKEVFFEILQTLSVGDNINVSNAVVSCYNSYQVALTNFSSITTKEVEVVETEIKVNKTTIKVLPGTAFNDITKDIVVSLVYSNNTTKVIPTSECTFIHDYNPNINGAYEVIVKYNNFTVRFIINVTDEESKPFRASDDTEILEDVIKEMGYDKDTKTTYGVNRGLPSIGSPKVLVIPVEFTDASAPANMVENIRTAFFGTSEETGWESLTSYYQKASFGKLNISGDVLPVYSTGKSSSYYDGIENGDYEIIKAALTYYDSAIDYSKYDSDGDGYIDSIYLVYTCEINRTDDNSMWWAYTYEYFTDDVEYYDNVEADFYLLAGYDFLFETFASGKSVKYNLETFIHESGHLLGLDDYYDTDSSKGPNGGLGGGDMMDCNVGDHNPFSKAILGWIQPLIMGEDSATITLKSFGSSGDALIIPKNWNGTYFDEYYIVDFYTPDGLNKAEAGYSGLFSTSGIRIYHIDATKNDPSEACSIWDVYKYNNSTTNHKLISLVEADGGNHVNQNELSSNKDLFKVNDVFKNVKWYDGTSANFELKVISINSEEAVIEVTMK